MSVRGSPSLAKMAVPLFSVPTLTCALYLWNVVILVCVLEVVLYLYPVVGDSLQASLCVRARISR